MPRLQYWVFTTEANLVMSAVIALVHLVVIVAIAFQVYRRQDAALRIWFWPALGFKLVAGVCLGLLYIYYYPVADTFLYFDHACTVADLARQNVAAYLSALVNEDSGEALLGLKDSRASFFVKLISVFCLITNDHYWATGFYCSFLSFLGAWSLVLTIHKHIASLTTAAVVSFLFLPSFVFWSSGLLKESLTIGALLFLCAAFLGVWFRDSLSWWHVVLAGLSLWVLWTLKYYYAAVLVGVTCAAMLCKVILSRRPAVSFWLVCTIWVLVLLIPMVAVTFLHPNFRIDRFLDVVIENNAAYEAISSPGSLIRFYHLDASVGSILLNTPWALISGLFRPFVWEVSNLPQMFAAAENLLLLILFVTGLRRLGFLKTSGHGLLFISVVGYIVILAVFLTLSAPNLGTISRYRAGYICFFTFVILCNHPWLRYVERPMARFIRNGDHS